jgi:hypothetical protein
MNVAQETLGFRRGRLSRPLSLLMSAFALPIPPACLTTRLHRPTERSPTMRTIPLIHSLHFDQISSIVMERFGSGRAIALNFAIAKLAFTKLVQVN